MRNGKRALVSFLLEIFQEELYDGLKEGRGANCIQINNVAININSNSNCGLFSN